jgi:hypothetical protein
MHSIHSLPDELLIRILWYIPGGSLQTFSEVSLRLNRISNRALRECKKKKYRAVTLRYEQDYHDLCIRVLGTDVGLYVEEVIIDPNDFRDEEYHNLQFNAIEDEMTLYQSAMEQCPYIPNEDIPGLMESLRPKKATMIFVILLLNLPNLRTLSINQFGVEEALDYLLGVIRQVVTGPPCDSSPFNRLQAVNLIPLLSDVEVFMALPSVLIIFVQGGCDYGADGELSQRDPTLPLSRIHEINFYDFVNSDSCITSLISGIDGHCIRVNEGTEDPIDHGWWPQVSFIRYVYIDFLYAFTIKVLSKAVD